MLANLLNFIHVLIGTYTPMTYTMEGYYVDALGVVQTFSYNVIPNGISGVDFEYIVMAIILLSILRMFYLFFLLGVRRMSGKD